jgi:hypothetical protein
MKTYCLLPAFLLFLIVCQVSFAQLPQFNQKQSIKQTLSSNQDTDNKQNTSDQSAAVFKNKETDNPHNKSAHNNDIDKEKGKNEWSRSDTIAVVASISALLQFIALCFTIGIMIRTARRQLRAYVFPDNSGLVDGTMLTPPQPLRANVPLVYLTIRNSGQTPAYKVISSAKIDIGPIENPQFEVPELVEMFSMNLGIGGTMIKSLVFDRPLTAEEIANIANGSLAIYVHGRVEYQDVFKKKRFTNFRLHYFGQFPPLQGMIFYFSTKGNDTN